MKKMCLQNEEKTFIFDDTLSKGWLNPFWNDDAIDFCMYVRFIHSQTKN